ncbi:hypothetical protein CP082626L3_1102A, partial [Chlamydia psittaci 08-2626_L3]
MRSI